MSWEENAEEIFQAGKEYRQQVEQEARRTAERRAALPPRQRLLENIGRARRAYPQRKIEELEQLGRNEMKRQAMFAELRRRTIKKPTGQPTNAVRKAKALRSVSMPNFMRNTVTEFLVGPRAPGTLPAYGAEAIQRRREEAARRMNRVRAQTKEAATKRARERAERMFAERRFAKQTLGSRARSANRSRSKTKRSRSHSK